MRELLKWISITSRYCSKYLDKKLAGLNINSSQHIYILKICETPGITQDQLFQNFYVNPSNITRALAHLEECGFLTRTPSQKDKRTWHLYPTDKARHVYTKILDITQQCGEDLLASFTEEEKALFLNMLQKSAFCALDLYEKEKMEEC